MSLTNTTQPTDDLATMEAFRMSDRQAGGTTLYATLTGYLQKSVAPRLLASNGSAGDGDDVFAAAAGLTELAGWMAHDAGRDDAAKQHFQRALRLAVAGGDTQLAADVMAGLSHVSNHVGQPAEAVTYTRRGNQYLAAGRPHPGVEARLYAVAACGFAAMRREEDCTAQLHLAERALEREPESDASPWIGNFDHAALAADAARSFRALGRLDSAKHWAQVVINLRPADRPRSRGFAQLMLASILIAQRKFDEACGVGREALDGTRGVTSFPLLQQLSQLGRQLDGYHRHREVATFLRLLQPELAARHHKQRRAGS